MHRACIALASLPLLTGCAGLGAWLPFGGSEATAAATAQPMPMPMPEPEYQRVSGELAQLREQQANFANALSRVQDPGTRVHHVRHINTLGERIQRLESRLRAAGRPSS